MKKKILTSLGCLAMAAVAAVGLVGCGEQPATPDVRFDAVQGYYEGQNVKVQKSSWKKITNDNEEDDHFGELTGAYEMTPDIQLKKVDEATKKAFGSDYVVCVTFAGKGRDITKVVSKAAVDKYPSSGWESVEEGKNETAQPVEQDFHSFLKVDVVENKTTKKVVYLYLDWDGDEGEQEAEIYRFVIPANLDVAQ